MVMAVPHKAVEQIILGLYDPINAHPVKRIAFEFPEELRQHFRREPRSRLRKIQRVRFKPNNRTGSAKFYFDLLFDDRFGSVEIQNMRLIMEDITDEYQGARPVKDPAEIGEWLRDFPTRLADRLDNGEDVLDLIPD